jgi:hypothetical protein
MKNVIGSVFLWISSFGINILYFIAGLIHLWTVLIAFSENGFVGAAITFFLPIISQIYWFFVSVKISGTFINTYSIIIIIYILLWIFLIIGAIIGKNLVGCESDE